MYRGCLLPTLLVVLQVALARRKSLSIRSRVVDGQTADLGEYPHVVFIQHVRQNDNFTGSIVAPRWVLTAAHCLQTKQPASYKVRAGLVSFSTAGSYVQIRSVAAAKKHPKFNLDKVPYYDLALLQVQEPFKFNKYVTNVGLAVSPPPYSPNSCYVVGFQGKGLERPKRLSSHKHSKGHVGRHNPKFRSNAVTLRGFRTEDRSCRPPDPIRDDGTCRTPLRHRQERPEAEYYYYYDSSEIPDGGTTHNPAIFPNEGKGKGESNGHDDGESSLSSENESEEELVYSDEKIEYDLNNSDDRYDDKHAVAATADRKCIDVTLFRRELMDFTDCSKVTAKNRPAQHMCSDFVTRLGDTGAPLMCSHVQAGVASAVRHPDKLGTIEMYTELEPFRCWIYETVPGAQFYSFNTRLGWKLVQVKC